MPRRTDEDTGPWRGPCFSPEQGKWLAKLLGLKRGFCNRAIETRHGDHNALGLVLLKKIIFFPFLTNNSETQPDSRQPGEAALPPTPSSTYFLLAQERGPGLHPELAQVPQLFYGWVCHESI